MIKKETIVIWVCLFFILLIGGCARFWGLGSNPVGMVDDEVENGYDAYSLIITGKDQWGQSWPVTSFRGFGDNRLSAYTYASIIPIKLFGLTPFAVRFPSAVFGTLTILLTYFLVHELTKDKRLMMKDNTSLIINYSSFINALPLLSAFLLAISPWHIALSRVAIEQAFSVCVVTAGFTAFLKGRESRAWMVFGMILLSSSLYIYRPNILFAPFIVLITGFTYISEYKKQSKSFFIGLLAFLIIGIPIFYSSFGDAYRSRAVQINMFGDSGTIDLVNEKRGTCMGKFPQTVCKLADNKYKAFITKFIGNYLHHFSPELLAIYGTATQYFVLPERGLLYIFEFAFFLIGVFVIFVVKSRIFLLILGILLFSAIPDSVTSSGHFGRYFISHPFWTMIIGLGILGTLSLAKHRYIVSLLLLGMYVFSFGFFLVEYTGYFPWKYSIYSHYGYKELTEQLINGQKMYSRIYISSRVRDAKQYIYYLFYSAYSPEKFQGGSGVEKIVEQNGWVRVAKVDTIYFVPSLPETTLLSETTDKNILLIGAPSEFPKTYIPSRFEIKDVRGDVIFRAVTLSDWQRCTEENCTFDVKQQ